MLQLDYVETVEQSLSESELLKNCVWSEYSEPFLVLWAYSIEQIEKFRGQKSY